jgi:peptidoglycan/LPS O-acetylase OafA/YrhL/lysophospholipase L1-like esterase
VEQIDEGAARSLGYVPALDGLRGLALLAIIVYHADTGWAPGAFLSVSTFFTLSGFLITSVLLHQHQRQGSISLRGFWAKRMRRLLPASLAAIAGIVVAAWFLADAAQWSRLRGDAVSSLAYVANWRFIATGESYGAAFESPSPLTHFWTLAIEEQLYILMPLLIIGLLAVGRGSRRWLAVGLGALVVASTAWSAWLLAGGSTIERVYYGTDTRVAELAVGALLAVLWRPAPEGAPPRARWLQWLGPLVMVGVLAAWLTADLRDERFYQGGLLAYALLTCLLIVTVVEAHGPLARALSWKPLVWVGLVSYGAYLVHYPVLIWLRSPGGLGPWTRLAVGAAITFAVAFASARWLEQPVRRNRWPRGARAGLAAPAAIAACVLLVVGITVPDRTRTDQLDLAAAQEAFDRQSDPSSDPDAAVEFPTVGEFEALARQGRIDESLAPRLAPFGDSTALMTSLGLAEYGGNNPDVAIVRGGRADLGCGVLTGVTRRDATGIVDAPSECDDYLANWERLSIQDPADVAVLQFGPWEVLDTRFGPDAEFQTPGSDTEVSRAIRRQLETVVDMLQQHHGMVALLLSPDVDFGTRNGVPPDEPFEASDPARMAWYNDQLTEIAASRERVVTVDLPGSLADHDDARLRPDGVHFTVDGATETAGWLAPELARLHRERTGSAQSTIDG